jgi:ATP-dependent helicase/nuclease subunit B
VFELPRDLDAHLRAGGTLIVPSEQRVRAVKLAYAAAALAAGARVWASPQVLTPATWARREAERRAAAAPREWPGILTATAEWLLWRQAALELAEGLAFLDAGALGESLQRASERAAEWRVPIRAGRPGSETQLLFEAQRVVESRCRTRHVARVSALIARLHPVAAPPLWRGFERLPPGLAAFADPRPPAAAGAPAEGPRAVRTRDATSQLEAIAAWCHGRLTRHSDARLLVMLPGEAGERERLAALIRSSLDPGAVLRDGAPDRSLAGVEGGAPFASLALPSQALLALTALTGREIDVESVSGWLRAPCWTSPEPGARARLAQLLRERGPARVSLRELHGALQLAPRELKAAAHELDSQLRRAAGQLGDGSATPRRWSERFRAALAALTWPGMLPADGAVHQTHVRWVRLLEEFGELAGSLETLGREEALALLRALAQRTRYGPADEDAAVTISPLLADPVVRYDGIWVGHLSADVLPQPVAPNPFLAHAAQIEAGMPEATSAGRRAESQALLAAWRAGAGELLLSVPERDQDLELLPSPALAALVPQEARPATSWLALRLHRPGCTESVTDVSGTPFNPLVPLPSGTRALTLQNACAFRAYAELRLGAAPPEQAEPGVAMDQRGLLLHAALQLLWQRLCGSQSLGALDEPQLAAAIADCVRQAAGALQVAARGRHRRRRAIEGQFDLFGALSPALERECRRAQQLIGRLCALERTRAPFTVEATEHPLELALGGGRVRMRLDRIDRVAGGRAVLDYKSGRPGSPDWLGERPSHPQLLAYLTALGGNVVGLATVHLTAREVRFKGVAAADDLLPKVPALPGEAGGAGSWNAQQERWRALIERLIRAFLAGDAGVDPAPGACDYCHLTDLCRIGAHLAPEPPAHADDADE